MTEKDDNIQKSRLAFPTGGISDSRAFVDQPGDMCPPDAMRNCIPYDTSENRQRGGKRPGLVDVFPGFQAKDPVTGGAAFIQCLVPINMSQRVSGYTTGARVNLIAGGGTPYSSVLEDADTWFIDNLNVAGTVSAPPQIYASKSLDNSFDTWFGRVLDNPASITTVPSDPQRYTIGNLNIGVLRNYGGIKCRWATRSTALYGDFADADTARVVNNICFRERNSTGTTYNYAQGRVVLTIIDKNSNVVRSWMIFDANLRTTGTPVAATTTTKDAGIIGGTIPLSGLHLATLDNNGGGQDRPWHIVCNDIDVGPEWTYLALTAFQTTNGGSPPANATQGSAFPDDDGAAVRTRPAAAATMPNGSPVMRGWILAIRNTALVSASASTTDYVLRRITRGVSGLTGPSAWSPGDLGASTHDDLSTECTAVRYRGFEALANPSALDDQNSRLTENYRPRFTNNPGGQPWPWFGVPWRTGGTPVIRERVGTNFYAGIPNFTVGAPGAAAALRAPSDVNAFYLSAQPETSGQATTLAFTEFGATMIARPTAANGVYARSATFRNSPLRFDATDHLGFRMHLGESVTVQGVRTQYTIDGSRPATQYRTTPATPAGTHALPYFVIPGVTADNSIGRKVVLGSTEVGSRTGDLNPDVVVAFCGQYDHQSGVARFKPDLSEKWRLGELPHCYNPGHGPIRNGGTGTGPSYSMGLMNGYVANNSRGVGGSVYTSVENSALDFLIDGDHATARVSVLWAPMDSRFNMGSASVFGRINSAVGQQDIRNNYNRSAQGAFPTCMDVDPWGMIYLGTSRRGCGYGIPLLNPPPNDWNGGTIANNNDLTRRLPATSGYKKIDANMQTAGVAMGYGSAYPDATLQNAYGGTASRLTVTGGTLPNYTIAFPVVVDPTTDYFNVPNGSQNGWNVLSITPDGFALQAAASAPWSGVPNHQYPEGALGAAGATAGVRWESEVSNTFITSTRAYQNFFGDRYIPVVRSICWWPRMDAPNNSSLAIASRFTQGSNLWIVPSLVGAEIGSGLSSALTAGSTAQGSQNSGSGVDGMGLSLGEVIRVERRAIGAQAWAAGTAYLTNNFVQRNGAYYVCNTPHTSGFTVGNGPPPDNTTNWTLVSYGNPTRTTDVNGSLFKEQPLNLMPKIFGSKTRGAVPLGPLTEITSGSTRKEMTIGAYELLCNSVAAYYGESAVIASAERLSPKNFNDAPHNGKIAYRIGDTVSYAGNIYRCTKDPAPGDPDPYADPTLDTARWTLLGAASTYSLPGPAGVDSYRNFEIKRSSRPVVYKVVATTRSWLDGFARGVYARVLGISIDTVRSPEQALGTAARTPGSRLILTTPEANKNSGDPFTLASGSGSAPGCGEDGLVQSDSSRDYDASDTLGNGSPSAGVSSSGGGTSGGSGGFDILSMWSGS